MTTIAASERPTRLNGPSSRRWNSRRDQADTHRVAPERDSEQDEHGRDAAAHRRHLRAGQQGITDACSGGDRGRNEDQVETQREPLAQRKQLQAEQHRRGDDCGDVQPADREQMGETAGAHRIRILFGDPVLVAGDERDCNAGFVSRQPLANVAGEVLPDRFEHPRAALADDLDRTERLPHGADPAKPGVTGEIVGAGKRHRRRRGEAGAQLDDRTADEARRRRIRIDRNSQPRRKLGIVGRERQADRAARDQRFDRLDPRLERDDGGAIEARRRDLRRAAPRQGTSERHRQPEPAERPPCPTRRDHEADEARGGAEAEEGGPLARRAKVEPGRDPAAEADREPRRKLGAFRLEQPFEPLSGRAGPRLPIAPSPLWKRRTRYVRGARPLHLTAKRRGKCA